MKRRAFFFGLVLEPASNHLVGRGGIVFAIKNPNISGSPTKVELGLVFPGRADGDSPEDVLVKGSFRFGGVVVLAVALSLELSILGCRKDGQDLGPDRLPFLVLGIPFGFLRGGWAVVDLFGRLALLSVHAILCGLPSTILRHWSRAMLFCAALWLGKLHSIVLLFWWRHGL